MLFSKHLKSHSDSGIECPNENFGLNDNFGPIDYILKNVLLENLSLKRKKFI